MVSSILNGQGASASAFVFAFAIPTFSKEILAKPFALKTPFLKGETHIEGQ